MGSLIGAISSQTVTEESKGTLSPVGNRASSVKVEGCLTASPIGRAGTKVGLSDPAVLDGKAVAQQIKGTPGITGLSYQATLRDNRKCLSEHKPLCMLETPCIPWYVALAT